MKNKLLVVSWTVYPEPSGSSVIVNNLADGFAADELVIAGQRSDRQAKQSWAELSEVPLYYLEPWPLGIRKGQRFSRWLKLKAIVRQLVTIIREEKITRVLAVFPDEFYCYAALLAAEKTGLPYDLWLHNSYLENREGLLLQLAERLQPRLFAAAGNLFVMSDELRDELQKIYPDQQFITLVHGFKFSHSTEEIDISIGEQPVRYLYSGSLNTSCLDASIRQLQVILARPNAEVHIFSGNPESFREQGIGGDQVSFHNFLPLADFVKQLDNYDIMLLPHGIDGLRSDFEYRTIFPTRTIPLLFSGKPIFAHSPEDSFLTDFLRKNDCALIVTEKSEAKLNEALDRLLNEAALREQLAERGRLAAEQFTLASVVGKIKAHCGM